MVHIIGETSEQEFIRKFGVAKAGPKQSCADCGKPWGVHNAGNGQYHTALLGGFACDDGELTIMKEVTTMAGKKVSVPIDQGNTATANLDEWADLRVHIQTQMQLLAQKFPESGRSAKGITQVLVAFDLLCQEVSRILLEPKIGTRVVYKGQGGVYLGLTGVNDGGYRIVQLDDGVFAVIGRDQVFKSEV